MVATEKLNVSLSPCVLKAHKIFVLSRGRGALFGKAGEWLVDYGRGDLSIVADKQFETYYEVFESSNSRPKII